jgi:hypothetical protein
MFNPTEMAVVNAKIFNMKESKALAWIKEHHGEITRDKYYRILGRLDTEYDKRKHYYMLEGVFKKHIDAIDRLELMMSLEFANAEKCENDEDYRTAQYIYNNITRQQEILTSYYNELQKVIEYDNQQAKGTSSFGDGGSDFAASIEQAERAGRPGSRQTASY